MNLQKYRNYNWRKIGFGVWLIFAILLFALHQYPIRFAILRLTLVFLSGSLVLGALFLIWNKKWPRRIFLSVLLMVLISALLPLRPDNPRSLRQQYVRSLLAYDGTPYVWGGESKRGIDCSGLMRCGLIDAQVKRGLVTFNPTLVREGFSLWWNDSSARALKEEYQNRTRLILTASSINQIDYSALLPGDMAVTSSGVHVLAYIGGKTWIEADPNAVQGDRVIQVTTPTRNAWFNMPVHVMRWRQLENASEPV